MMNGVIYMNATQIIKAINELKNNIYSEIHHRILLKYTGQPEINDPQLFFILLPFFNGSQIDDAAKIGATTVGIVHASLAEHEKVKEQEATEKEQQLTVLSGDYYSGRYYELLAHSGNIPLIRHLSTGIVNRCEQQIKVYEPNSLTLKEWMHYLTVIESELIVQFYKTINAEQYRAITMDALTILRMKKESLHMQQQKSSLFLERMFETGIEATELQQQIELRKQSLRQHLNDISLNEASMQYIEQYCLS